MGGVGSVLKSFQLPEALSQIAELHRSGNLHCFRYLGHAPMGRVCDEMRLAVKPDRSPPAFVPGHPCSHRH